MNIFIINGGQHFEQAGGEFQKTLTQWSADFFNQKPKNQVRVFNINHSYDIMQQVENFVWADLIIYHIPVWWFQVPYKLKEYIDEVFTAGHETGIYKNDGRSRSSDNPKLHYGTGGMLQGRKYMLTTSWNAPIEAFTTAGEFFDLKSEDDVFFSIHKMNEFVGMTRTESFHFHEMEKGVTPQKIAHDKANYLAHLEKTFYSTLIKDTLS